MRCAYCQASCVDRHPARMVIYRDHAPATKIPSARMTRYGDLQHSAFCVADRMVGAITALRFLFQCRNMPRTSCVGYCAHLLERSASSSGKENVSAYRLTSVCTYDAGAKSQPSHALRITISQLALFVAVDTAIYGALAYCGEFSSAMRNPRRGEHSLPARRHPRNR